MSISVPRRNQVILAAVVVAGTAGLWFLPQLTAQKSASSLDFERDIVPVFKQNCNICHSGAMPQGELDLSSVQGALKGGKSGKVIVPGSSGQSLLLEKIVSGTMPPGKIKLEEKDVSLIRRWIDAGAG